MSDLPREPAHMRWLVRLRWGAILSHAAMIALVGLMLEDPPAVWGGLALLTLSAASNAILQRLDARGRAAGSRVLVGVLLADVVTLTVLLALTGGPMNPFTALYVVHVALAAVVCARVEAWVVTAVAVLGYGALFLGDALASHDHARMVLHLRGMWIAFAVAAVFVTVFVSRARRALAEHEMVQAALRTSEDRQARLAALATLAGGAAHELSTPLGTIAIAVSELDKRVQTLGDASVREDAALIVAEVRRCKKILEHLAAHGGEAMGEASARTTLGDIVERALEDVPGAKDVRIEGASDVAVRVPAAATATALRGILRNARQASGDVSVRIGARPPSVSVEDRGEGMSDDVLARVGEPFFTTREPGRGMGLGVFLARTLAERLGGALEVSSQRGRGTRVTWTFPEEAA